MTKQFGCYTHFNILLGVFQPNYNIGFGRIRKLVLAGIGSCACPISYPWRRHCLPNTHKHSRTMLANSTPVFNVFDYYLGAEPPRELRDPGQKGKMRPPRAKRAENFRVYNFTLQTHYCLSLILPRDAHINIYNASSEVLWVKITFNYSLCRYSTFNFQLAL